MKKITITQKKRLKNAIKVKRYLDGDKLYIKKSKISDEFASSLFKPDSSSLLAKGDAYIIRSEIEEDELSKIHQELIVIVPKNVTDPLEYIKMYFINDSFEEHLKDITWKMNKMENNFNSVVDDLFDTMNEIKSSKSEYLNYIKQRQRQGIDKAKAEGKHLGRPKMEKPNRWDEIYPLWKNKKITAAKAIEELGIKKSSFYKLVKQEEESNIETCDTNE